MAKARELYKNSIASPKASRLVAATELGQRTTNNTTSQQAQVKEKEFFSPNNRTKATAMSAQNTHGTNSIQKHSAQHSGRPLVKPTESASAMIESILNGNSKRVVSPNRERSVKSTSVAMVNNLMSDPNSASTSFKNLPFMAARKESQDTKVVQVKVIPNNKIKNDNNLNAKLV